MPSAKRFRRLDQLFSQLGYGSRIDARIFLRDGRMVVQGNPSARFSDRVDPDLVRVDDQPLDNPDGLLILLNKPTGYVCSHDTREGSLIYELLPERWNARSPQIVSIGRLDKDTSGLILLTDQSELVHQLTSPKKHVPKIYEVRFKGELRADAMEIFQSGAMLLFGENKPCLPAKLEILGPGHAHVEINEGRYHQVRRMFGAVGVEVTTLQRLRFGPLDLTGVASGEYRLLPLDTFAKLS